jgi:hypothetical protein
MHEQAKNVAAEGIRAEQVKLTFGVGRQGGTEPREEVDLVWPSWAQRSKSGSDYEPNEKQTGKRSTEPESVPESPCPRRARAVPGWGIAMKRTLAGLSNIVQLDHFGHALGWYCHVASA